MTPIHSKATLNPNHLVPSPPVLADPRSVFDRIQGLASLARALDPSVPPNLRFYRRTESDEATRNNVSFKAVFTKETDAIGMATEQEQGFWDVIERILPAHMIKGERKILEDAPTYNFSSPIDAAVYGAHVDGKMKVSTKSSGDPDWVIQSTNGQRIPELDFMSEPSLSRWLYLSDPAPIDDDPRAAPGLYRVRSNVRTLMDVLSRPYEQSSASERARVAECFGELEAKSRTSFERNHQHGWIGYALAHGAHGWTAPLMNLGASPHQSYNGVPPTVWAVAQDAGTDLDRLLAAGAASSLLLPDAPKVYDEQNQDKIEARLGGFSSILHFASMVGASRCVATLCQHGVDLNMKDTKGNTPLHVACANGDENVARVLVNNKADLSVEDNEGNIPAERIPFNADSMFKWMETLRLAGLAPESSAPKLNLDSVAAKKLPWDDAIEFEPSRIRSRQPS